MKPLGSAKARTTAPLPLVLYVEDEEENFAVAQLWLQSRYRLLWARSDREACAVLTAPHDPIIAILMDIHLKGSVLDGVRLTEVLRGRNREGLPEQFTAVPTIQTPIIFVTAGGAHYPEEMLIARGGTQLIKKPVDFTALNAALSRHAGAPT